MKGDFTRLSFAAGKNYTQVLRQQGRVDLDADWNEQGAILEHLRRTALRDLIGGAGAPRPGGGFALALTPDGADVVLSPGRIYVDGVLCELAAVHAPVVAFHSDTELELRSLSLEGRELAAGQWVELSTESGTPAALTARVQSADAEQMRLVLETAATDLRGSGQPVRLRRLATYLTQPSLTGPAPFRDGSETAGQTDLVVLEVWQRHVTALEDPGIREVALGGPDTTTRSQTVWQLRVLKGSAADCDSPDADWRPAASGGRLSTSVEIPPGPSTPCDLPPQGGFRGLENRLYRAEIHTGGPLGMATWKWSRDNGSVVFAIEEFPASLPDRVRLRRLGRDQVLTLHRDDWVEILDEATEFANSAGTMARVVEVDEGSRLVTLDRALPAGAFSPARHARVRRWDQSQGVDADGLLTTSAGPIELEDGVQVSFGGADFQPGDYWMFAARSATRQVEPLDEAPPHGVQRHFCRLGRVVWTDTGAATPTPTIEPCDLDFPPLTAITADDVGFDNSSCDLVDADTVQEAIERLCAERDLRHHNKHLHGWGIVCGLQVHCGADVGAEERRSVTVRPGYAIDCEGNDILVDQSVSLDVLSAIAELDRDSPNDPVLNEGDGEVCLRLELDEENGTRFRFERYTPEKKGVQSILQGTLLMDFYQHCIKSVVDWLRDEVTPDPGEEKQLVGPTQRRITTLLNLLIQLWNPTNGRYVFLSRKEHGILRSFYQGLRALLQSKTFCGMFENARPFPDYPFEDPEHSTVFGKGGHSRLRLSPNGVTAYTVGVNNRIHVYDLEKEEMVADVEFPGGEGTVVRDVAFSEDGSEVYAIATLQQATLFSVADVAGTEHRWRRASVICNVPLVTLATAKGRGSTVYAVAKGSGLFSFDPSAEQVSPSQLFGFNAVGHLVLDAQGQTVFATASSGEAATDRYDSFARVDLDAPGQGQVIRLQRPDEASASGDDDIALDPATGRLVVVVDGSSTGKELLLYDAVEPFFPSGVATGLEDTAIRLAYSPQTRHMVLSFEDSFRLGLAETEKGALVAEYRHPVQISPMAIAVAADGQDAYVLNQVSNTINTVPARYLSPEGGMDVEALAQYRTAVLEAFFDLFGGFLQYLKDCFCDHLLVACPECDEDDVIYLACVSIRGGEVYRVCNFSRRKYVKSFPTVGYWLSVLPVWPMVKQAVEWFCCSMPALFFSERQAPRSFAYEQDVKASRMRQGIGFVQATDFGSMLRQLTQRMGMARGITTDFARSRMVPTSPTTVSAGQGLRQGEVVNQPVELAAQRLAQAEVQVAEVRSYDPNAGTANLIRATAAPTELKAGTRVELYEQDGVVKYYSVVQQARPAAEITHRQQTGRPAGEAVETFGQGEVASDAPSTAVAAELGSLRTELAEMRKTYEEVIAARDQQISDLQGRMDRLERPNG